MSEETQAPNEGEAQKVSLNDWLDDWLDVTTILAKNNKVVTEKVNVLTELIPIIRQLIEVTTAQGIEIEMLRYKISMLSKGKE